MENETKQRFVLELKLQPELYEVHILEKRFEIARKISNACKREMKKRMWKMIRDSEYQSLLMQEKSKTRSTQLNQIRTNYGVSKQGAEEFVKEMGKHYNSKFHRKKTGEKIPHLDSHTVQKLANDAWNSTNDILFKDGKSFHFKKEGQFSTLESKTNKSGIRFVDRGCVWNGLNMKVAINKKDDYAKKALEKEISFCRIKRKTIRGRVKYYLQIVLKGTPPDKFKRGKGKAMLLMEQDSITLVTDEETVTNKLCEKTSDLHKKKSNLIRKIERSLKENNPTKYTNSGELIKYENSKWNFSNKYYTLRQKQIELERKLAAVRKMEHNIHANEILKKFDVIYTEKFTSANIHKNFNPKQIETYAPISFLSTLSKKLTYKGIELYFDDEKHKELLTTGEKGEMP